MELHIDSVEKEIPGQAAQAEGDFVLGSYCEPAEEVVTNMTRLRGEMTRLAENVGAVEQLMRGVR